MGVVYRARDPDLDRDVAIKLLRTPAAGSSDPEDAHPELRLLREARAMAKLVHPNLVTVFDVGTYEGRVFVAMEYVQGQTLKQWVSTANPNWRQRLEAVMAAGRGIAKAHAAGVVHRDLKPDNILFSIDDIALVADFGLARSAGDDEETAPDRGTQAAPRDPLAAQLTSTGALLGTPAYMSPEQFLGKPADERSDQFSFAVVVYWALWGQRPFAGQHVEELATAVLAGRVQPPPQDSAVPKALFAVVERALRTQPEERYASVDEFLSALDRTRASRHSGRTFAAIGVLAAIALLVAGALFTITRNRSSGGEPEPKPASAIPTPEELRDEIDEAMKLAKELAGDETHLRMEAAKALKALPELDSHEESDYEQHGTLTVMRVAEEHIDELDDCLEKVSESGIEPPPGIVMELEIDAEGQVTGWSTPLPGEGAHALAECIGKSTRAWHFPRPESGKPARATLHLNFAGQ